MIAVVIPALNEAANIAAVVQDILAQNITDLIIVVDNGSTDQTAQVAAAAGAQVVSEPRRGYGFACAAGSHAAIANGADIIVYIDADHSSRPQEMSRLLEPLAKNQADLVLGSRVLGHIAEGAMLPHQRFGNWLSSSVMNKLYKVNMTDLGPYRAIRVELLQTLQMREMTFGWPTEMTVKSLRHKARVIEVPVSWHQRHSGQSKVSGTIRGSLLAAWYILSVIIKGIFGE
ncbi:MAG TPA: glycosyltransferase family 2 protein [Anaerolineae bacterium]|nr:glycosyltransferase family 2 protein [Anaerolineae bacterium]